MNTRQQILVKGPKLLEKAKEIEVTLKRYKASEITLEMTMVDLSHLYREFEEILNS